ncbi:hypothetical protein AOL_s00076g90 [Orbilia oligospora ATCC 24927]|uniref:Fido domain-containing protein n=1 Tax=Arthrobotrys oligospora (strain ATCC 24927 / CBS 115.81 / DSM 1491) TaxID=756982 RepID=G1X8Y3_ARTOA|nr:hypothetical protein AOL_s00076g90 [Orbilia oligospora ATCC 24927]EGX50326.1 hypothetical protein AOL_s00076g90 [Orbilia oligospora ATCC 24927]
MSDSGESSGSATITPPETPVPRYEKKAKSFDNIATKEFSRMIYASNTLENTGLSLEDTTRLCELVFRDEKVPETYNEEKLLEEQRQKEEDEAQWTVIKWIISAQDYFSGTVEGDNGAELTIEVDERRENKQARREVIQHARAWKYLLERFCIGEEELSVNLIKNTHTVLCAGYELEDCDEEWWQWSGAYRKTDNIGPGTLQQICQSSQRKKSRDRDGSRTPTQRSYGRTKGRRTPPLYIRASAIENYMDYAMSDFRRLRGVESMYGLNGYCDLAAWLQGIIMTIWPFRAENSKLARLLMNGVLWRYCGIVIPLGEGKKEKDEYLEILRRGTEIFHGGEFSVPVEEQKGYEELALVVRKKAAEAKKRIEESMRWKWRWT